MLQLSADIVLLDGHYAAFSHNDYTTVYEIRRSKGHNSDWRHFEQTRKEFIQEVVGLEILHKRLVIRVSDITKDALIKMYTTADKIIFKELADIVLSLGLRTVEEKYLSSHMRASELIQSLINQDDQYRPFADEMLKLLTEHQSRWDTLVMWLKSVVEVAVKSEAADVSDWCRDCSSTRMAKVLDILKSSPQLFNEISKWIEMAQKSQSGHRRSSVILEKILQLPYAVKSMRSFKDTIFIKDTASGVVHIYRLESASWKELLDSTENIFTTNLSFNLQEMLDIKSRASLSRKTFLQIHSDLHSISILSFG